MSTKWELLLAAAALAAGLWQHVRTLGTWLQGFLIGKVALDKNVAGYLTFYLNRDARRRSRLPHYSGAEHYIHAQDQMHPVAWEDLVQTSKVFWYRRAPLFYAPIPGEESTYYNHYKWHLHFIRGTVNVEKLLIDACAYYAEKKTESGTRYAIHYHHGSSLGAELANKDPDDDDNTKKKLNFFSRRLLHWTPADIGHQDASPLSALALMPKLQAVVEEARFWFESRAWYREHGVTWRRGYLFHGAPGTGKTSLARSLAQTLDLPVHVLDLASMSNEDLRKTWGEVTADAPCMVLIEDIDAVFKGRESIAKGGGMMSSGGLTYDALLNCLDGVERVDGLLTVITTNHLQNVDQALTARPGRIDRIVQFEPLDFTARLKVAVSVLGEGPDAARLAQDSGEVPAARFLEQCCREALKRRYESLPHPYPYR